MHYFNLLTPALVWTGENSQIEKVEWLPIQAGDAGLTSQTAGASAPSGSRKPHAMGDRGGMLIGLFAQESWYFKVIHASRCQRIHFGCRLRAVGTPHTRHSHIAVVWLGRTHGGLR